MERNGKISCQFRNFVFRTPPYRGTEGQTVTEDQNVFFELYRPSDEAHSEPKHFRYKPRAEIRWLMGFHPLNIIAWYRLWAFTLQILSLGGKCFLAECLMIFIIQVGSKASPA